MNVTRQEALDFLDIATRNWPEMMPLSEDDIGDVATALLAFAISHANPGWQPMETAPLDGKHCILAVQEGAFIYSVQGSFDGKRWNAVHAVGVKPLCWMPNVRLPPEFLPAKFLQATNVANGAAE